MTPVFSAPRRRIAAAIYRYLLRAYPARIRRDQANDMVELFVDLVGEASRRGRVAALTQTLSIWGEAVGRGLQARTARRHHHVVSNSGHDATAGLSMGSVTQDFGYALRSLRRAPGFTLVTTLTLALGIGANSALFAMVDNIMLRPAGTIVDPERVVLLHHGPDGGSFSWPDFEDLTASTASLDATSVVGDFSASVGSAAGAFRVTGALVSDGYLDVFGVPPQLGRVFTPAESEPTGAQPVVIVSDGFWREFLGGEDSVVGSEVRLNGTSYTIVGVTPPGFRGGRLENPPRFWVPAARIGDFMPQLGSGALTKRGWRIFRAVGRLAPEATMAIVQSELSAVAAGLEELDPSSRGVRDFSVSPGSNGALSNDGRVAVMQSSRLLAGVVGLVLLLACLNVANLLLARATGRRSEVAVRAALGASRTRLVRQLLAESLVLSLVGGAVGLTLGLASVPLLSRLAMPTSLDLTVGADSRVLLFAIGLSLVTGVLFGLVPALSASSPDLVSALKASGPATAGSRSPGRLGLRVNARSVLVVGQVALSLVLLSGAGLLIRTLSELEAVDAGFDAANVLTATIDPGLAGIEEQEGLQLFEQLLTTVRAMPGVTAASLTSDLPLDPEGSAMGLYFEGSDDAAAQVDVSQTIVAVDLFGTLGIPVLHGRDFTPADRVDASLAVVVNQSLADRFWPGEEAIGKRLGVSGPSGPWFEVIGVVGDHRQASLREEARPHLFWPMRQIYAMMSGAAKSLVVRTSGDPVEVLPAVRQELARLAPELPLYAVTTLRDWMGETIARERRIATLLTAFAGVALLLAGIGLYGTISYAVAQRRPEIGIRMALGARPHDAVRLVVLHGAGLGVAGIALGLAGSVAAMGLVRSLLFGVSPLDLPTLSVVSLTILATALLASWLPARRAAGTDPLEALESQ